MQMNRDRPILSDSSFFFFYCVGEKKVISPGNRSNSAIDLQAVQRATARAQYAAMNRMKAGSGASLRKFSIICLSFIAMFYRRLNVMLKFNAARGYQVRTTGSRPVSFGAPPSPECYIKVQSCSTNTYLFLQRDLENPRK